MPWPAGSTTSPTATCPPRTNSRHSAGVRKDLERTHPIGARPGAGPRWPMPPNAIRLPFDAFGELIDGCEMDVTGDQLRHPRGPGRLLPPGGRVHRAAVAGHLRPPDLDTATPLADDLGVALQLTNILRDVLEDRGNGSGLPPRRGRPRASAARRTWRGARCPRPAGRPGVSVCAEWFDRACSSLPLLDRRSRACVAAMAGIYRRLLDRMARDPMAVTQGRVSVPTWEKAGWRSPAWRAAWAEEPRRAVAMSRPRLVVIGGGLAGISAALAAADAGCEVTLLERRRRLGGSPGRSSGTGGGSTTASTSSCAAALGIGLPRAARHGRRGGLQPTPRRAGAGAGGRPRPPSAIGCRRHCTWPRPRPVPPPVARRPGALGGGGPRAPPARPRRPELDNDHLRGLAGGPRPESPRRSAALWNLSCCRRSTCRPARRRWPWRSRCSEPASSTGPMRGTWVGPGAAGRAARRGRGAGPRAAGVEVVLGTAVESARRPSGDGFDGASPPTTGQPGPTPWW